MLRSGMLAVHRREEKTYTDPRYVRISLKFGTRVTMTIVLCTVPLVVRDIVVNTRVISVICLSPATNEFGLHVDFL